MNSEMTVIEHLVISSGRKKVWYGMQLEYKINEGMSGFNRVSKGLKIPNADRRLLLAKLLEAKVSDLWEFDNETGQIKARMIGGINAKTSASGGQGVS